MAYIYRYQLRDSTLRDLTVLTEHTQIIQSVLEVNFSKNLKDSIVEDKYFEFKLYSSVAKGQLQEMGRKLKASLSINSEKYGFIRMEQTLYALVYSQQDNLEDKTQEGIIHIEIIDSILLEKQDQFIQRANSFFDKTNSSRILRENSYNDNVENIIKNYYIDILESYVDKNSIPELLKSKEEKSCFFIKGYHRHNANGQTSNEELLDNNMLPLEKCFDVGYVENRELISGPLINRTNSLDYLKIFVSEKQPTEKIEEIENELKLFLGTEKEIYTLSDIDQIGSSEPRKSCMFKVHNVGQALATSLSYDNDPPFLYFDYGMPFGRDSFTRPACVHMPTNPGTTIIISHTHKDHWFRIADDINAYQCHWFIPEQPRRAQLNHTLAEIIVRGGSVNLINNDITFTGGKITYSGTSKINSSRIARHIHETGLTMRIEAHDVNRENLNILIAGDQRYDYVDKAQLNDIDILVASHHGGTFCWSTSGTVPTAKNHPNSIIIYSYGEGNTHDHPSKVGDYKTANWLKTHSTCDDGEFSIVLLING